MLAPLFIAHGSPMMALEDTPAARFLDELGRKLKPKAIVVFSAHWESPVLTLSSPAGVFDTIHDFGGFPPELHAMQYSAQGSPELLEKLMERFRTAGIEVEQSERGLDHGSWVPLSRMFPQANIPVVQASVHPFLPPQEQFRIGAALRGLEEEGVLVIGSGVTVHNLRRIDWRRPQVGEYVEKWAYDFDSWLVEKLEQKDHEALFRYMEEAPNAREAVPREEHFVPLFIVLGSSDPGRQAQVIHRSYEFGVLSYMSLQF